MLNMSRLRCSIHTACKIITLAVVACDGPASDAPDAEPGDAPIDALDPGGDEDGDGVRNELDNCSTVQNADQHDEDGDRVGDVCDNCPPRRNADQANRDGDDLGDLCDPRDGAPGNRIVLFDPMVLTSAPAWSGVIGGIHFADDGLHFPVGKQYAMTRQYLAPPGEDVTFLASFTIEGLSTSARGGVAVLAPAGFHHISCGVGRSDAAVPLEVVMVQQDDSAHVLPGPAIGGSFTPGTVIEVTSTVGTQPSPGKLDCAVRLGAETASGSAVVSLPPDGLVGIEQSIVPVRVAWLFGFTP